VTQKISDFVFSFLKLHHSSQSSSSSSHQLFFSIFFFFFISSHHSSKIKLPKGKKQQTRPSQKRKPKPQINPKNNLKHHIKTLTFLNRETCKSNKTDETETDYQIQRN
jgi:hypothetical protein